MRMIKLEHVSVAEESSGRYLAPSVPEAPIHLNKSPLKVAQALYSYGLLKQHNSIDSLQMLMVDSTIQNKGWRGGPPEKAAGKEAVLGHLLPPHERTSSAEPHHSH